MFREPHRSGFLELAEYLRWVQNVRQRFLMTRFRVRVLTLRIETGRWESGGVQGKQGIPVELRVCQCCNAEKAEDEIHFLLECDKFVKEREFVLRITRDDIFSGSG
jgi:hypothetical protein